MKKSSRLKCTVYVKYKDLTAIMPPLIGLKGAPSGRHDTVKLLTQMVEIKYIILMISWQQPALWVFHALIRQSLTWIVYIKSLNVESFIY